MWVKDKDSLKKRKIEPVKVSAVLKVDVPEWYPKEDKAVNEYDIDVDGGAGNGYDINVN